MPYTNAQNLLKKILPGRIFRFVYNIALFIYRARVDIFDDQYYADSLLYYLITRQKLKADKIRMICMVRPYTMVGRQGLIKTYDIANAIDTANKLGCFVECGVARGGCAAMMALIAARNNSYRRTWLFDSFEGMGKPSPEDEHADSMRYIPKERASDIVLPGYCRGTYAEVKELLFDKLGLSPADICMVKGWFKDKIPEYKRFIGDIALLRIDCDWYEPTKCCLENLYDSVIPGGFIIIDDYNSFPGCKKATDEFIESRNIVINMEFDNRGGCYFVKKGV